MVKPWTCLLLTGILLAVLIPLHMRPASAYSFGNVQALGSVPGANELPTTVSAADGTLWVIWQNQNSGHYTLLYKTYAGLIWSSTQIIPTGIPQNRAPSVSQLLNGTIIVVFSSNQTGHWNLYYLTFNKGSWSNSVQLTSGPFDELSTATTVGADSALWLAWERDASNALRQIYYKTLSGNVWSGDNQLTSDPTLNVTPGVMTAKDRTIWVSWAKFSTLTSQFFIYYQIFNGTWSSPLPLTTAKTNTNIFDVEPSVVQDRNGTIWAFWSREVTLSKGSFEQKLFFKFSGDAGSTWSVDKQLTFGGDSTNPIDDVTPSVVQGFDKSLWVFYSSDPMTSNSFQIYYIKTNPIFPVHDLAVSSVQFSPNKTYPYGDTPSSLVQIKVTVSDLGDFAETAMVSLQSVNNTALNIFSSSLNISSGSSALLTLNWNTSQAPPGRYTIKASVAPVAGETVGAAMDNVLRKGSVMVLLPGDLDKDGRLSIDDAAIMGSAYLAKPGDSNWNPDADLNRDGVINIFDFAIMAANYGKTL